MHSKDARPQRSTAAVSANTSRFCGPDGSLAPSEKRTTNENCASAPTSIPTTGARHEVAVDPWLVPPDTSHKRVVDRRREAMRLSALFEEFTEYLRVEREATPRTIKTYRWCFQDFVTFARQE